MKSSEKFDLFEKAIEKPITASNGTMFLEDDEIRSCFITDYTFFQKDANYKLYADFIIKNLGSNNIDFISDLLVLASRIGFYAEEILDRIEGVLIKNSHHVLKLLSFDYMNTFFSKIPKAKYLSLSESVKQKSTNELVIFQAHINLILKDKEKYWLFILKLLEKNDIPGFNYRLNFNLLEFEHLRKAITSDDLCRIKDISMELGYDKEVTKEILSDLEELVTLKRGGLVTLDSGK